MRSTPISSTSIGSDTTAWTASVVHQDGPGGPGLIADLADRLPGTHLVVGRHHGDQTDVRGHGVCHLGRVGDPGPVHADDGQRAPQACHEMGAVEHRGVLDCGGHHPPPLPAGKRHTLDSQVVRLGPACGEDHLERPCADGGGNPFPGVLERLLGPSRRPMATGGVAEGVGGEWRHRLPHTGPHRRGGGVVEVDDWVGHG